MLMWPRVTVCVLRCPRSPRREAECLAATEQEELHGGTEKNVQ